MADHGAAQDKSFADFLESILQAELDSKMQRTREMLLKTAGLPAIKLNRPGMAGDSIS